MEFFALNNGIQMPALGYGVYRLTGADCEGCVLDAVCAGYRAIDTAQAYGNEEAVGNAIKKCGVPREAFFITTKVGASGYERAGASLRESLQRLQTEYIDLVLLHRPCGDYYGAYRAMEEAYKEGWLRAIGVSNFYPDRLVDLCRFAEVPPTVNQVETHVFYQQREAHACMEKHGVRHQSWAPLAQGKNGLFDHPMLTEIGQAHRKTAAQVALRFLIQEGVAAIPKSARKDQMALNLDVFDFRLTVQELAQIRSLDKNESLF